MINRIMKSCIKMFFKVCFFYFNLLLKIFKEVNRHYEDAFYLTWRRNCKLVTSRKLYTQSIFDEMIEPLLSANTGYSPTTKYIIF